MSEGGEDDAFLLGHLWSWLWAFSVFAIPAFVIPSLYFHYKKDVASVTKTWKKSWLMEPMPYHVLGPIGWISPVLGIGMCLLWSMFFHFKSTTSFAVGCNVPNPLPSISYAIGTHYPERWFFGISVLIMSHQRLIDANILFYWLERHLPPRSAQTSLHFWNYMLFVFQWIENIALYSINFFNAVDFPFWHEKCFHVWAVFQQAKMVTHIYLQGKLVSHPRGDKMNQKSYWYRTWLWRMNIVCIVLGFFSINIDIYHCHNGTPIPYLYSFCALLEYLIVLSNIMFNCCVMFDWPNRAWFVLSGDRNEEMPHYETNLPNMMVGQHLNWGLYYKDANSNNDKAATGSDKQEQKNDSSGKEAKQKVS